MRWYLYIYELRIPVSSLSLFKGNSLDQFASSSDASSGSIHSFIARLADTPSAHRPHPSIHHPSTPPTFLFPPPPSRVQWCSAASCRPHPARSPLPAQLRLLLTLCRVTFGSHSAGTVRASFVGWYPQINTTAMIFKKN